MKLFVIDNNNIIMYIDIELFQSYYFNKMVRCWKKLALGSENDWVDLIRCFGSDQSPNLWYLLKSRKKNNIKRVLDMSN